MKKIKARDMDTLMSILAVIFVVAVFLFMPERKVQDIVMVGCFIAAPTKFIAIARCLEIIKGDNNVRTGNTG